MTPALRDMPVTIATWNELRKAWLVVLPGNVLMEARDEAAVRELVAKHVPGDAVKFMRSDHAR